MSGSSPDALRAIFPFAATRAAPMEEHAYRRSPSLWMRLSYRAVSFFFT